MKISFSATRDSLAGKVFGMSRQLDASARHRLLQTLAWIWLMVAVLALLSLQLLGQAWLAQLLMVIGVSMSVAFIGRTRTRRRRLQPAPYLSRGCNTVWQLDREG